MSDSFKLNHTSKRSTYSYRLQSFQYIDKYIYNTFHKKYFLSNLFYGACVINNIVYNERTLIVAKFKDFLIMDDSSEFLKRYYTTEESLYRLPKFFSYYITYNKIFPNYTSLPESKYIYKNIHRKQKMIDLQQESQSLHEFQKEISDNEKEKKKHQRKKNMQDKVFDSEIYDSIIRQSQDLYLLLFGVEKLNENKNNSISSIKNIICEINKYDYEPKVEFNKRNSARINQKNSNLSKKRNTSSSLTKQSTLTSSSIVALQKFRKITKKNENNKLIALKKVYNNRNESLFSNKSAFTTGRLVNSKSKNKNELLSKKIKPSLNNITLKKINNNKNEKNINRQQLKKIRVNLNSTNNKNNFSALESKISQQVLKMEYLAHKIIENRNNMSNKEVEKTLQLIENPRTSKSKVVRHNKFNSFMSSKRNSQINKISSIKNHVNLGSKEFSIFSHTYRDLKNNISKNTSTAKFTHKKFNTNISDITENSEEKKLRASLLLNRIKNRMEKNLLDKIVKVNKKEIYIKEIKNTIKNGKNLEKNECLTERANLSRQNKNTNIFNKDNLTTTKKNFIFHKKIARNDLSLRSKEKTKIIKNLLFSDKSSIVNNTTIKKCKDVDINKNNDDTKRISRIDKSKVLHIININ